MPVALFLYAFFIISAYSLMSLLRHWHFQSSAYDLGVFDQVMWHYSRLERPSSTLMGLSNVVGDHFDPALAFLAPLYWICPKVEILLVAQAVLMMLPIFPIYLFSRKRLGKVPAFLIAVTYSLLWGIQLAIQFDFHEISVAVPAIAFAIYFMDEEKWVLFFISDLVLVTSKEDQCLLVAFLGIYLLLQRKWDKGLLTFGFGVAAFILELKVLMPWLREGHAYKYWSYSQLGSGPAEALWTCLTRPWLVVQIMFSEQTKIVTMAALFVPFLMLAWISPLVLLTIPLISERMLSTGFTYWVLAYHYSAVVSPVITMASADGLQRVSGFLHDEDRRKKFINIFAGLSLLLNVVVLPKMPIRKVFRLVNYFPTELDKTGEKALGLIPEKASVLAQDTIVPHLSHRDFIWNIMPETISPSPPSEDYIIACENLQVFYFNGFDPVKAFLEQQEGNGYHRIFYQDGWTILKKRDRNSL